MLSKTEEGGHSANATGFRQHITDPDPISSRSFFGANVVFRLAGRPKEKKFGRHCATAAAAATAMEGERVTEQLGLSAISVIDDIINSANEYMYKAVDALRGYLSKQKRLSEEELDAVRGTAGTRAALLTALLRAVQGINRVITRFEAAMDTNADKFELFCMRNIFNLPAGTHVAPPDGCDTSARPQDVEQLDAEILELVTQLQAARAVHMALLKRLQAAEEEEQALAAVGGYLRDAVAESQRPAALTETVSYVIDQIREVQQSTESLRQARALPDVAAALAPPPS